MVKGAAELVELAYDIRHLRIDAEAVDVCRTRLTLHRLELLRRDGGVKISDNIRQTLYVAEVYYERKLAPINNVAKGKMALCVDNNRNTSE